jgi:hypothetical protein
LSKIIIGEIKEWRKEQRKIQERLEKEKKKEKNKPILVEKPIKSEKSQPILIMKVNKFEEKPPANPPKIVEAPLKKIEPIKINEPITENKITKTPISATKTDEKVTRAEEHPKFETKTFEERRKESPHYNDLFHPWEIPEEEETELLYETLDILSDIESAISEGVEETVKHEYFESEDDPWMEEFQELLETDLKLLVDKITMK